MPGIKVGENEAFEQAIKRFKKQCEKAGVLADVRKRECYEKPSVRKKKKALAARKRLQKKQRRKFLKQINRKRKEVETLNTEHAGLQTEK